MGTLTQLAYRLGAVRGHLIAGRVYCLRDRLPRIRALDLRERADCHVRGRIVKSHRLPTGATVIDRLAVDGVSIRPRSR